MAKYQPKDFEEKWKKKWREEKIYQFKWDEKKKKFYVLVELPYTSGDLHIGHWFAFTTPDVLARYKRMQGFNVFFPLGFDAFGLPAENAAIKKGIHPQDWTMKNITTMEKQFHQMGSMINNWENIVITCLPEYYRFNQWIFLKMWEKGLIYRGKALSNWCPSCQTVLANENVIDGRCWRCDSLVLQKEVPQWFIKITQYASRLLWPAKPQVDWPLSVRLGQNNWIGESKGVKINFKLDNGVDFWVFTTRLDTIFGATFLVVAPEKVDLDLYVNKEKKKEVKQYLEEVMKKSEQERKENKEKTGVFTGLYGKNPLTGEKIPLYVADYVLGSYGTGKIMGVPAHDQRDFDFATRFNLPIKKVINPSSKIDDLKENKPFVDYGILINSQEFDGLTSVEAIKKILQKLKEKKAGEEATVYHLRDWSISRQRYWGTPIPIIHCPKCGIVPVDEKDLPVVLPYEVDFTPKGKPPLATNKKWLMTECPKCHGQAQRDPETLDTFFDSSWYWYRYVSPHYDKGPFDKKAVEKLTPVDIYFGGAEHTLGHTLYARFFTKFFHDLGLVDYEEFALKRVQHGIVLGPDGAKMSKSKGNVINPDEQVREYGADTVRVYLCFMMPYEATGPWSNQAIAGVYRFLKKVWEIYQSQYQVSSSKYQEDKNLVVKLNKTIKKVTEDIERIKLNTAVAAMMEFMNAWEKKIQNSKFKSQNDNEKRKNEQIKNIPLSQENAKKFLQILAPFAPFLTEEIWWEVFGEKQSIHLSSWPKAEEIEDEQVIIPIQVNGKLRGTIKIESSLFAKASGDKQKSKVKNFIEKEALKDEKIKKYLEGKKYKFIYVEGKIGNFVILAG